MQYQPVRIADIVENVNENNWFLPAIQREFVWKKEQIERLFDSIMADFPIGSFLFWKVESEEKQNWPVYEFISQYNQESPHNKQANMERADLINKDVTLILDGQQRITSLLIGLQGSYRYFWYRPREEKLYLNLLKKYPSEGVADDEDSEELAFGFKFRENDEPSDKSPELWYPVGDILKSPDRPVDARNKMKERLEHFSEEQRDNAASLIDDLHSVIHTKKVGFYYKETSQNYDKALQVFVRANSAGQPLENSDLLLATATAQWEDFDARDEIRKFTDSLNTIIGHPGFFKKDFVLKACLYLCEDLPIKCQVKNFTKANLRIIENNWETIKKSLEDTVSLMRSRFGFDSKYIAAKMALLPIAFYLLKKDDPNFRISSEREDVAVQVAIRKWFIFSTLKGAFGRSSDTTLTRLRELLKKCDSNTHFPADELYKSLEIEPSLTDAEIEDFLEKYQYGQRYTGLVLALLYPDRNWMGGELEQDHIFPQAEFNKTKLKKRGYEEEQIDKYMSCLHKIPNLELLPKPENLRKGAKNFSDWLKDSDDDYRSRHLIPSDHQDYELDHFLDFFEKRKSLITKKLKEL